MASEGSLESLSEGSGSLRREPPDAIEISGLQRMALMKLDDATKTSLAVESRFDLAYSAAHALCLTALRRQGFRSSRRDIVFQVLPLTLGLGPEVWRVMDKCHQVRNRLEYEGSGEIDERLLADLLTACRAVAKALGLAISP